MNFIIHLNSGEQRDYEAISNFKLNEGVLALYKISLDENSIITAIIPVNSILYIDISHST